MNLRKPVDWIRKHPKTTGCLVLIVPGVLLNLLAFMHAYAMTHFAEAGTRTLSPESLSGFQKAGVLLTGVRVPKPSNSQTPASLGMPFEVHRFPGDGGIDYEGWYIPCAEPKGLIILFHGYAACKCELLPEAQALRVLGYEIFLVDFRGSGGSSGYETTVGYREADDVIAAVDYAHAKYPSPVLILYGRSSGSVAILRALSLGRVHLDAVVLECPFDRLLSTVKNRFSAMGVPSFPCAQLLVFWGGIQHGYSGFQHNPVEYAKGVRCLVLLLFGGQDPRVRRDEAETIFENLACEKQFVVFEHAGHESYLAADPEKWKHAVTGFLDVVSGRGR